MRELPEHRDVCKRAGAGRWHVEAVEKVDEIKSTK